MNYDTQRVNRVDTDGTVNNIEDESEYIETQAVFTTDPSIVTNDVVKDIINAKSNNIRILNKTVTKDNPIIRVHCSSEYAELFGADNDAKTFTQHFPFGRGHPGEKRSTGVSRLECIIHYLKLSRRQFDRDPLFVLYAFDTLSLQQSISHLNFSFFNKPIIYQNFGNITKEHLISALKNKDLRSIGRNEINVHDENEKNVLSFLNSIQSTSAKLWGSNAERNVCRREAFATAERYGQPTIFLTITPNTDFSLTLAYLAGQLTINSLFDLDFDLHKLSKIKLEKIANESNVSAAIFYNYIINILFKIAIGIELINLTLIYCLINII
jgi:hypothetical protein